MVWHSALRSILIGIPVGITFVDYVGYVARVEGVSMQPTLNPLPNENDYVLLNRWAVRQFNIQRGDIVSIASPRDPDQILIKRVIALEGDIVRTLKYKQAYVRVPPGHCWVEGDHSQYSMDSNFFGPVALGLVTAKASHILWPVNRWSSLQSHLPADRKPLNSPASEGNLSS